MSNASDINTLEEFAAVPLKEKLAYFFGEMLSQSLFYYLVLTLSIYFYTDVMHISATTIGIVVIVSRIFDAFTDLLIGTLVDRTKSRLGKARAWVIFMTAPYALSMFLLYCVPASWTTAHQIAYILYDNCPDFSGFNVRKHGLKTGSLKVRTRITVVRVPAQIGKAVLLCIGFKNTLLVGNGIALALQLVLMGKSWVKGGNWLLVGLS